MSASLLSNIEIVKMHNRDRYTATLFAPENKRSDLFTLYAFDAEVSRIRAVISDPLPGEIRLQWWREVINGERAGEASGNALASGIRDVMLRHALPLPTFEAYFDAKIFEFYHDPFPDTVSLEAWCGETSSAIIQMAALILDKDAAKQCADASGHGGVALGIAQIVAHLPRARAQGQCFLPRDLLKACGLEPEDFIKPEHKPAIKNATDAFCALGISHFDKWKTAMLGLPVAVKPALLPITNARHLLKAAAKPAASPATDIIQTSALRGLLAITSSALF
jgi:15-cis-phytoene synthase